MEVIDRISTPHMYKTGKLFNLIQDPHKSHSVIFKNFSAREALYGLKSNGSQSIIIGGVTGAGKAESAKRIIEFLCGEGAPSSLIAKRILKSQIIMESFGNAQTMGNRNSSRFCKFVQVVTCSDNLSTKCIERCTIENSREVNG